MELNDNEFDAAFRKRISDAELQYEEAAWDKMAHKLKRRDRIVFLRKSAVVLLAFLAGVWAYHSLNVPGGPTGRQLKQTTVKKGPTPLKNRPGAGTGTQGITTLPAERRAAVRRALKNDVPVPAAMAGNPQEGFRAETDDDRRLEIPVRYRVAELVPESLKVEGMMIREIPVPALSEGRKDVQKGINTGRKVKRLPLNLALSAGPEFNAVNRVLGGNAGFSAGLTLGVGISEKLDLQAGLKYSHKAYSAGSFDYKLQNALVRSTLAGIDATCGVLEIPLQASYRIMSSGGRSIRFNAGISSYLMLKEDYVFRYNYAAGPASRTLEKTNANQHFLSVADLSATYFMQVKDSPLKLGIEPFVKLPLGGIGEGDVNLKSSGISLKLRYDLGKKNN
ncbi:hypothetical protein [Pedobacter sp. JY14-1]|uniref:hypothetical protein n=1 Tax=Pedobacter sp. JY14-1 TaxID=3034151 RepID=UPI0023E34B0E|nr:hypothetical protein [Pedobacter sp. JY14-1]